MIDSYRKMLSILEKRIKMDETSSAINEKTPQWKTFFNEKSICIGMLCISLCYIVFFLLKYCCFIYGDDVQIMMTTGIGRYCRTWSEKGRFWPLGLFDYNVLLLLFPNGADIVSITIWKIIILCLGTLFLFKVMLFTSKDFCSSLLCMGLLLFNQVFFSIHMTNRAAERFLYFSLALFAYSYYLGYSKNKNYLSRILWYISAFLCAIYSTYAKEVAFVIFVSIPLIELLFNNNLDRIDKYFQWSLLTNAIVFLLVWTYRWFYVERFKHTLYNNIFDINFSMGHFFSKVESMFSESHFLIIALFLLLIRGSRFLILHDYKHIFSDALLFAGGAYVLATFY